MHQNESFLILLISLVFATHVIAFVVFMFVEYLICLLLCATLSVTYVILCLEFSDDTIFTFFIFNDYWDIFNTFLPSQIHKYANIKAS